MSGMIRDGWMIASDFLRDLSKTYGVEEVGDVLKRHDDEYPNHWKDPERRSKPVSPQAQAKVLARMHIPLEDYELEEFEGLV